MLLDAKAEVLRPGFAAQWLNGRPLSHISKDPATYPDFDEPLAAAMMAEVEQFFGAFLTEPLPLQRLLDPGFGFVNDRLARHYGFPLPGTSELVRVDLPPGARGGLLFQGAWLTASSEANRTSPVKRGRFLLERILCRAVPPPPPDVPAFMEPEGEVTVRERLAEHRKSPACAACHNLLDPVGLGLEELDGIGALRSVEAGAPVDSSGAFPSTPDVAVADVPYVGAAQLVQQLQGDSRFRQCLTRKLSGYALGRQPQTLPPSSKPPTPPTAAPCSTTRRSCSCPTWVTATSTTIPTSPRRSSAKCQGAIDTGKVVDFKGQPLGDLYVTLLQAMGAPDTIFGEDGTAPLLGALAV